MRWATSELARMTESEMVVREVQSTDFDLKILVKNNAVSVAVHCF